MHCARNIAIGDTIPISKKYWLSVIDYLYAGSGPFPGVIDLFGTVGGLVEFRAAMLASHGLVGFTLSHALYEDLPSNKGIIDLEYFKVRYSHAAFIRN